MKAGGQQKPSSVLYRNSFSRGQGQDVGLLVSVFHTLTRNKEYNLECGFVWHAAGFNVVAENDGDRYC